MSPTRVILEGRPLAVYTRGGSWKPAPYGIPSEVNVRGERWRILMHTDIYGSKAKGSRLAGCAIEHERVVILDPSVPGHELATTLGHELAHAHLFGAKESSPHLRRLTREQEECLCDLFAPLISW